MAERGQPGRLLAPWSLVPFCAPLTPPTSVLAAWVRTATHRTLGECPLLRYLLSTAGKIAALAPSPTSPFPLHAKGSQRAPLNGSACRSARHAANHQEVCCTLSCAARTKSVVRYGGPCASLQRGKIRGPQFGCILLTHPFRRPISTNPNPWGPLHASQSEPLIFSGLFLDLQPSASLMKTSIVLVGGKALVVCW